MSHNPNLKLSNRYTGKVGTGRPQWLTPVILATQRSGGSQCKTNPSKKFVRPYLKKPQPKKGLVEWFKV
jgi:hypothetical protein